MAFDPSTAKELDSSGFDPSTAQEFTPVAESKPSSVSKMRLAAQETIATNPITRATDAGVAEENYAKQLEEDIKRGFANDDESTRNTIKKLRDQAAIKRKSYVQTRLTIGEQLQDAKPNLAENIVGSAAGGLLEPTNLIGGGPGKTVATTFLKGAAPAGAIAFLQDYLGQHKDVELKLREKDPEAIEALYQALVAAGIGGSFNVILSALTKLPNRKSTLEKPKIEFDPQTAKEVAPVQETGLPELNQEFQVPPHMKEVLGAIEEQAGASKLEDLNPNSTQTIRTLNAADRDFKGRSFKQELPKIKEEFKVEEAPKVEEQPLPAIDREGFGPEITETIRNPFIPDEQVRQANVDNMLAKDAAEAAGTHEMKMDDFSRRQAFLDEANNPTQVKDAADFVEATSRLYSEKKQLSESFPVNNPKGFAEDLWKSGTMKDAMGAVMKHSDDPQAIKLANTLSQYLDNVPLEIATTMTERVPKQLADSVGVARIMRTGDQLTWLRGDRNWAQHGMTVETVLHEASHNVTDRAIWLGMSEAHMNDPAFQPHRDYTLALYKLYKRAFDKVKKDFPDAVENLQEFNAYAWTNKDFQKALSKINAEGGNTVFGKFMDAVKQFLNIAGDSVLDRVLKLQDRLPDVQATKADLELATRHLDKETEAAMKASGLDVNKQQIDKMVTPFPITPEGMKMAMTAEGSSKDLGGKWLFSAAKQFTVNQVKAWERHPVVTHAYSAMRDIYSRAHIVFKGLDKASRPFTRASRELQLEVAYGMTKLQTPEWQAKIKEAGLKVASDDMLREVGMSDKAIAIVKDLRPVMDQLLTFDRLSASRLGRDLPTNVLDYWPISHGGQFVIKMMRGDKVEAVMGFDSYSTMRQMEKALREDPNSSGLDITAERRRSDAGEFNDAYNEWMMGRNIPEWAQRLQYNMEKSRAAREAAFELARTGVKGFIGEVQQPDTGLGKTENSRLIDVFHRRLRNSRDFYIRAEITNKVLDPMLSDTKFFDDKPNLYNFMMNWNNHLLGYDISGFKPVDEAFQIVAEGASKIPQLVEAMYHGYDAKLSEPSISATAARSTAQSISLWASIYTLAGNTANMAANVLNPAMTASWLGIPSAIKLGADPIAAVAWHGEALIKTIFGWGTQKQMDFLKDMSNKGFIQPHIFEDTAVIKENRGNIVIPYKDKSFDIGNVSSIVNKVSNQPIEVANNIFHLAFYMHMVEIAERQGAIDLSSNPNQRWQLIVDLARDSTGDYAEYARRLFNKETGTLGALTSNFAQWQWNQIGREMTNFNRIFTETKNVGVLKAAAPTMALLTLGTLFMGLRNAPGFTDYENIRQYVSRLFPDNKWKPADQFLKDVGVGPEWRGSMLLDVIVPELSAEKLGLDPSEFPELSAGQSFASAAQAPTVVSKFILDVGTIAKFVINDMVDPKDTPGVSGKTLKEEVEFSNSLPKGIRPLFQKTIKLENPEYPTGVLGKYGLEYKQTPKEQVLNKFGFTSIRQGDERRDTYNDVYLAWQQNQEVKELKDTLIHSLLEGDQVRAKRLYHELAEKNVDALDNLVEAAMKEAESRRLDRKQALGKEYLNASKAGRQKLLADRIKNLQTP